MKFNILIGLFFLTNCQIEKISLEEKALNYLISTLKDSAIFQTPKRKFFSLEFEKDMKSFKDGIIYSNGTLCLISELPPGTGSGRTFDRITQKNIDEYLNFSDSLHQSNYLPAILSLPQDMKKMNYEEFKKSGRENSYFFTVRRHLRGSGIDLIEINLVPHAKSENPFEYTFHIFLENDEIFNWEFSSKKSFEYEIDC